MRARARGAIDKGRLVGYARVSTEEQGTDPQTDELRAASCGVVHEEHASGSRPVPARLLSEIRPGETLVVVRLDRLARSVSHLLAVIEQLEAKGAHFRSLRDPIEQARLDYPPPGSGRSDAGARHHDAPRACSRCRC